MAIRGQGTRPEVMEEMKRRRALRAEQKPKIRGTGRPMRPGRMEMARRAISRY